MDSSIHLQSFTMFSKTLTFPHALDVTDLVGKPVTITGIIEQSPTNEKLFEVMCFRMADKNGNLNNILKNEQFSTHFDDFFLRVVTRETLEEQLQSNFLLGFSSVLLVLLRRQGEINSVRDSWAVVEAAAASC